MITYRYMTHSDLEQVEAMLFDFCAETEVESIVYESMVDRVLSGETRVIVAENGSICGMVGYIIQGPEQAGEFLYVKPEKRNTIIGGKLYGLAIEDGKEDGVKKFIIFASEGRAKMYRKLGYNVKGILMEREG